MKLRKHIRYGIYVLATAAALLFGYREAQMSSIPLAEKRIPFRLEDEEVPVPRRPGTRSIRIVGPPITKLRFQLDFRENPTPLDWKALERIDRSADIMLEGVVDIEGNFAISRVNDRGHPRAGRYVKDIVATWKFLPFKSGRLRYYFNVPTNMEHMKVQIDLRGLEDNKKYVGPYDNLEIGMIYFFEGIDQNNVMLIN